MPAPTRPPPPTLRPPGTPTATASAPPTRRPLNLDDVVVRHAQDEDPRVSILYLGFEKSGKSTYLSTFPNPLFIQTDPNDAVIEAKGIPTIYLDRDNPRESWDLFYNQVLPAIRNRELPFDSICIDSDVFLYEMMQASIPMETTKKGEDNTFKYWDGVKRLAHQFHGTLVDATKPFPGEPTRRRYHIGLACHLSEITGTDGGVIGFRPGVQGSFKNEIGRLFKTVLYCDTEQRKIPQPDGASPKSEITYFCHTRPPNKWIKCGDSMAAPGSRWKPLPDHVDGTFPGLAEAWGFPSYQEGGE